MNDWLNRPKEIGHLLNPAFCGLLLYDTVEGYSKRGGTPFPLIFLTLPLVLHWPTRNILPKKSNARLHAFVQKYPEVKIGLVARVKSLRIFAQEGLRFAMQKSLLQISEDGLLVKGPETMGKLKVNSSPEVEECRAYAKRLGVLFSDVDDLQTLFLMWGIKP